MKIARARQSWNVITKGKGGVEDYTQELNTGRVSKRGKPISRFDISASRVGFDLNTRLYLDLDWSNRHVVRTRAVSSQWPLSVYEVLVAWLYVSVLTRPSTPAHTTCRIGLLVNSGKLSVSNCCLVPNHISCGLVDLRHRSVGCYRGV